MVGSIFSGLVAVAYRRREICGIGTFGFSLLGAVTGGVLMAGAILVQMYTSVIGPSPELILLVFGASGARGRGRNGGGFDPRCETGHAVGHRATTERVGGRSNDLP